MRLQTRHALRSFLTACVIAKGQRETHSTTSKGTEHEAEGIIQTVDPISRELSMEIDGKAVTFYVPLDCLIMLNDERVKMRLLQTMDRASVRYTRRSDHPIAYSVVVDWETHYPQTQLPEATARPLAGLMECT